MLSKKECFYNLTKTTTTKKQEEAEKLSPRHFVFLVESLLSLNIISLYDIELFSLTPPGRGQVTCLLLKNKKNNKNNKKKLFHQSFQIHLHKIHKCLFIQPSNPPTEWLSGPVLSSSATSLFIHD